MHFFAKAVVTGFAISLGAALFKKFGQQVGLVDKDKTKDKAAEEVQQEAATDPNLQHQYS